MCQQQYQSQVMDQEAQLDVPPEPDLGDSIFAMMVAMNQVRYAEMQDALPAHKRDGYSERMAEAADMRRKERREAQP